MKIITKKRILACALATAMVMPFALSACKNDNGGSEDDVWTITLNFNDDVHRNGAIVVDKEGGKVKAPKDPTTEGNSFIGWFTEKEGGDKVDFANINVTSDMTVYAHWEPAIYDVNFNWNLEEAGHDDTVLKVPYKTEIGVGDAYEAKYRVPMSKPDDLETANQFIGWTSRADKKTNETNTLFPASIKKNMTYYALWADADAKTYTVNYDMSGVTPNAAIPDDTYTEGLDPVTLPIPSADGYDFKGWSFEPVAPTPEEVTGDYLDGLAKYEPTGDNLFVKLYAVWQTHKYTVRFINQTETFATLENVVYGSKIEAPEGTPTREGYEFKGWYATPTDTTAIDFETYTVPANSENHAVVSIYAQWKANGVVTTIFDAEFCPVPDHTTPGYSGNTTTPYGTILVDGDGFGASTQHQEGSDFAQELYYVSYMYEPDFTLTFVINADKDTDATLVLRAAGESAFAGGGGTVNNTFTSADGEMCVKMLVNDVELNYGTFTVVPDSFQDFTLGRIHLKAGENVLKLVVANDTPYGGTAKAAAPVVDCIKINGASCDLSWQPEYDNLANR